MDYSCSFRRTSLLLLGLVVYPTMATAASYDGQLLLRAIDESTGKPIPARLELFSARGRPVKVRAADAVSVDNSLAFEGEVTLRLKRGQYNFFLEAGPEFSTQEGYFVIERHADDTEDVPLKRQVDMGKEGWWAADFDVTQRLENISLLMRAVGLDYAPVTMQANIRGKCREQKNVGEFQAPLSPPLYGPWAARWETGTGSRILLGSEDYPRVCGSGNQPTAAGTTKQPHTRQIVMQADSWFLPVWLAELGIDAIAVLDRNSASPPKGPERESLYPRDEKFFPGKLGPGRWKEKIYHHALNCGFRLPPAAGSGAGTVATPVGANRVYAFAGPTLSRKAWDEAFSQGAVIVTNGPLLRTRVEGYPPGHVFRSRTGSSHEFQIALELTFYERARVEYLEILKNGEPVHYIRLGDLVEKQGRLPELSFDASGWFAVRAVTSESEHYQLALTAPYYVEIGDEPFISRRSVEFFLDWLAAAEKQFAGDESQLTRIREAEKFWRGLLAQAR